MVTLTIVVNLSIVAEFLPQSSTSYPKLYQFYICSVVISGLSLVLSTISVNLAHPESKIPQQGQSMRCTENQDEQNSTDRLSDTTINTLTQNPDPNQYACRYSNDSQYSSQPSFVLAQNDSPLKSHWTFFKPWIIDHWKNSMTRRKIDMLIGVIYFIVVLIYTSCFFSSLK
ncbi:uncharacterized protein LOC142354807 [Convolutriloba macropyga]|uniref:uncharacterized protein LOC142354807 n=1 Tax=Convolutriloba macropyga TaxID=536237 RepID=UPI003F51E2FF